MGINQSTHDPLIREIYYFDAFGDPNGRTDFKDGTSTRVRISFYEDNLVILNLPS